MITVLDIGKNELNRLLPTFTDRQSPRDIAWQESLRRAGFSNLAEMLNNLDYDKRAELGLSTELPPCFRVGRLRFEKDSSADFNPDRVQYLDKVNYPALMMFRDKSAVLNFSHLSHESIAKFVQVYLAQSFCNLEPIVVKCTAIDLQNFGGSFSLLTSAFSNLELLTTTYEVDAFFEKLPEDVRYRNKSKGHRFPYLYQYNRTHRESALPYHFILVSSFESDLSEKHKSLLNKLIANNNSAKAGLYFLILFETESAFEVMHSSNKNLPVIMEFEDKDNSPKIEIIDPEGLNTAKDGGHKHLMIVSDFSDDSDLDRLATYCRRHLNRKRPDPVRLVIPESTQELWKNSAANGIVVPIGKAKGSEVLLSLGGRAIVHNALVGGAVGTGKTNLLNAIILQCAALYSPEELRISILDYKNGTEFAFYEPIPHIYALSLGSGTKFGQDLLAHLQSELQRRAEMFKSVGANNLESYRSKVKDVLPRHLVVIDEFQVLLQDRKRGMESGQMLEDLVRRGRSFGFNFILSTQSLKDGALTPSAAANIGCRICLRLSETECSNFLSTDNILPSTFEYTGQAVYNDKEGRREGNAEFRVAYYSEAELNQFVKTVASMPSIEGDHGRYIYHGSVVRPKAISDISRPPSHVYIGLEEGIPPLHRFSSLDPSSGLCIVLGRGGAVETFKANLVDDLKQTLNLDEWREWTANDLEDFTNHSLDFSKISDLPKAIILNFNLKDAANMSLQNVFTQLINGGKSKLFLFAHTSSVLRSLYIDRQAAEMTVYCDQRCFAEVSFGAEMVFDKHTVAVFLPGDDSHSVINIPCINPEILE